MKMDKIIFDTSKIKFKLTEDHHRKPEILKTDKQIKTWCLNHYLPLVPSPSRLKRDKWLILYDVYDPNALEKCLKNQHIYSKIDPDVFKPQVFNDLKKIKFLSIVPGLLPVYYSQHMINNEPKGRYYALCSVGLQSLKREIRNEITKNIYNDLDINNCHPSLLYSLCVENKIKCPFLKYYCENRENVLNMTNDNRSKVKTLFIQMLYGSLVYKHFPKNHFVYKFGCEINTIIQWFSKNDEKFQDIYKFKQKKFGNNEYKAKNSAFSYYLQIMENNILQFVIKDLVNNGKIYNYFITLMFDGIYIPKTLSCDYISTLNKKIAKVNSFVQVSLKNSKDYCKTISNTFDAYSFWKKIKSQFNNEFVTMMTRAHFMNLKELKPLYKCESSKKSDETLTTNKVIKCDKKGRIRTIQMQKALNESSRDIYLAARMGTGKTFQIKKYLQMHPEMTVCMVTFRRSLGMKYKEDMPEFYYYEDKKFEHRRCFEPNTTPRLIVQLDSFHKIRGEYDLIILDEATYIIDRLFSTTNKIIIPLIKYLNNVSRIIVADAYLNDAYVNWFKSIRKFKKSYVIQVKTPRIMGYIKLLPSNEKLLQTISDGLKQNQRVVLASNSKTFIENHVQFLFDVDNVYVYGGKQYKKKFTKNEYAKINKPNYEFLKTFVVPNKKILIITSSNKLQNLNVETWKQFDMVAYSPTVVAGVSFDLPNIFDKRIAYFTNRSCKATLCVQQLFRVRYPKDKNLYIRIAETCSNGYREILEDYDNDIEKYMKCYANLDKQMNIGDRLLKRKLKTCSLQNFDCMKRKFIKNPQFFLIKHLIAMFFQSKINLSGEILKFLKTQGYHYQTPQFKKISLNKIIEEYKQKMSIQEMIKVSTRLTKAELLFKLRSFGKINDDEYDHLRNKSLIDYLTKDECHRMNVYHIQKIYNQTLDKLTDKQIYNALNNGRFHELDRIKHECSAEETCLNMIKAHNDRLIVFETIVNHTGKLIKFKEPDKHQTIYMFNQKIKNKWLRRMCAINILKMMNFQFEIDKNGTIKPNVCKNKIKLVLKHLLKHQSNLTILFEQKTLKKVNEILNKFDMRSGIIYVNSILKFIGRKITTKRVSKRNSKNKVRKEIIGYDLNYLVEDFTLVNNDLN